MKLTITLSCSPSENVLGGVKGVKGDSSVSESVQKSNLLSRWHQLQLKLICEEMHALQLVNWRQAEEEKGQNRSNFKTLYTINSQMDIQPIRRSTTPLMISNTD